MTTPVLRFCSPTPPAKSGIAKYCLDICTFLADHCRAIYYSNIETSYVENNINYLPASCIDSESARNTFFHIGNNKDHEFVYRSFMKNPGLLVLHDACLHHLIQDISLATGNFEEYAEILEREHGPPGRAIANARLQGFWSDGHLFRIPLTKHVVRKSTHVVLHSIDALKRISEKKLPPYTIIPHYSPEPIFLTTGFISDLRDRFIKTSSKKIFLSLGYITKPKMIDYAIRGMAELHRRNVEFHYVIGGSGYPAEIADLVNLSKSLGIEDKITITGYLSEQEMHGLCSISTALVSLRYPSVGESSGTLSLAATYGLPAVVFNFGSMSELPETVSIKIPMDNNPITLANALLGLSDSKQNAFTKENLLNYMKNNLSIGKIAHQYLELSRRIAEGDK